MTTFNVGYTSPGTIVVPAASSSDRVPAILQGLFDGSNGGGNLNSQLIAGPYASVAALANAWVSVPEAQKPALAKVTGLGLYQWIPAPYGIWIPALGSTNLLFAPPRSVTSLGPGSSGFGTTEPLVISRPQYPLLAEITYRAYVAQTGGATLARTYVNVNGTTDGIQAVSSFPSSTCVTLPVRIPGTADGAPSTFSVSGGLEFGGGPSGSAVIVDGTDSPRTRLSMVVSPFYANVGGTPF